MTATPGAERRDPYGLMMSGTAPTSKRNRKSYTTGMENLFKLLNKVLMYLCIAFAILCIVHGFKQPHCFIMGAFYIIVAALLGKCVAEYKED